MPIFEYKCKKCGHVTEFLEKASGTAKHVCEECKGSDLQRVFSGFSVGHSDGSASQDTRSCPTGTCPIS